MWAGWDDIADLDGAVGDDHAVNQQFEQPALTVEIGASQTFAHTLTERLSMGCQASRLALALRVVRKLMFLSVQRLQPVVGIAPTSLVFG
jgi:hypothetical protein